MPNCIISQRTLDQNVTDQRDRKQLRDEGKFTAEIRENWSKKKEMRVKDDVKL